MFGKKSKNNIEKELYKKEIQEYNQKQWKEPIKIEELVYSNYDENNTKDPHNELVFIIPNYDLEWMTSYPLKKEVADLMCEVLVLRSLPYKHLTKERQLAFLRFLGQGIVASFSENDTDVKNCIEQASSFHKKTVVATYKNNCLWFSTFLLFFWVFELSIAVDRGLFTYSAEFSVVFWGFIGAYLSIFYKTVKSDGFFSIDKSFILGNIVVRYFIGVLFGVIALYLIKVGFVNIKAEAGTELSLWALVAGFSEKFVPDALEKYENKFSKEDGSCRQKMSK